MMRCSRPDSLWGGEGVAEIVNRRVSAIGSGAVPLEVVKVEELFFRYVLQQGIALDERLELFDSE